MRESESAMVCIGYIMTILELIRTLRKGGRR
jgi:hypothetical protein